MRRLKLKALNQCTEKELLQEDQQKLGLLRKEPVELDLNFPTYFSAPNDYDISCAVQKLKELERKGIKVNPAVMLILIALHRVGVEQKSCILFTTFNEIKNYTTNLDNNTISKSLNFLHKNKIIIFISGKGQRKSLIVLKMFDESNN